VYNRVAESNNAIDSKIHNTLALTSGLVTVILGVFYYATRETGKTLSLGVLAILGFGVCCFMLTMIVGVWSYKPAKFDLLRSYDFVDKHKNESLPDVKEIAVATLGTIIKSNWTVVNGKANAYKVMLLFFTLGTIAFSIGFLILLTTLLRLPC